MNKRAGFTTRFLRNPRTKTEKFDTVFGTFPNRLYVLTDEKGEYAITGEEESDYIVMKKVDKNNKYQWVLVDADTGTICFFTDLKNYMSIDVIDGQTNVKRSDILLNGTFTFNSDKTITMKNGYNNYCLAFKRQGGSSGDGNGGSEAFNSHGWSMFDTSFGEYDDLHERFNANVDIPLEVIKIKNADAKVYSTTWKFELVYDLRNLTDNEDTIKELQNVNASGDAAVDKLNAVIENNKKQYDLKVSYKDNEIKEYRNKINEYESNWFVKTFLKK